MDCLKTQCKYTTTFENVYLYIYIDEKNDTNHIIHVSNPTVHKLIWIFIFHTKTYGVDTLGAVYFDVEVVVDEEFSLVGSSFIFHVAITSIAIP